MKLSSGKEFDETFLYLLQIRMHTILIRLHETLSFPVNFDYDHILKLTTLDATAPKYKLTDQIDSVLKNEYYLSNNDILNIVGATRVYHGVTMFNFN